ncbi:MAG TPA: hypothetical protein VMH22_00800 [bacterium]|nr:hypothetical protein [bacterium]
MVSLLLLALLGMYHPENWQFFPSMDEVRCISASVSEVYVAVPTGVCVFDRPRLRFVRALTVADGLTGEVRLCAHNPSRGDVFIATDGHIHRYVPATGLVEELTAPFKNVSSIGIAENGAYFETDAGPYFRASNALDFNRVSEFPSDLTWYGGRDTLKPRNFPFLTPYFVTDEQLINHPITLVRPDKSNKRLFAAVQGYGIVVYNPRSGFSEGHIRFGPSTSGSGLPSSVSHIARVDNRLWFIGGSTAISLDSTGDWYYFLTRPGDLVTGGFQLLYGNVTSLERDHGLTAISADSSGLLLGTTDGIYSLGSNKKLVQLLSLPRQANGLLRLHDSLIFGTDQGLFLSTRDSAAEYTDPYGATNFGVFDIASAGNGTAYFGAIGGIVSRTADGRWFHYVPPGFDLKQPIRTLAAAGTRVFMATPSPVPGLPSSVITVLDTKDGSYTTIDASRGLPVAKINSLYADDHYLWIASPGLISRLDYTKELR